MKTTATQPNERNAVTATNFEPQEAPEVEEDDYSYEDCYCCPCCGCSCYDDDDWDEEDYEELVDSQTK